MNMATKKKEEKQIQKQQEEQEHELQHHRAIWGRLAIAEVPYPVIAADNVVISLYANRLLFRLASSTFTVMVYFRDVVRIVFFAEVNSIGLQVNREDGVHRAYIVSFQEPNAGLMLYDVLLPLLPPNVQHSSLAQAVTPCTYTTDYPSSLLSSGMMTEAGFYELFPRSGSPLERKNTATRLFFPTEERFLLSGKPSLMVPSESRQATSSPPKQQEQPDVVVKEISKETSEVESLQRDSEAAKTNTLRISRTEPRDTESAQDEPRLVTYDVVTGEVKDYEGYTHNDMTPLSRSSHTLVDHITPISYSQSHSSPGPQPRSSSELLPRSRGVFLRMRSTTSGALLIPRGSETFASPSAAAAEGKAVKTTTGGIILPDSLSISTYSQCSGVGTSSVPLRLPRPSSSIGSSNDHVYNILVGYGPAEQF
ncbi:hypothetical protein LSM04_002579 [Trypanosoma melophagium]|uniref:uncharacterized protein n=1 Tax=Trypanosoma melophagium TaxID=715481 RepID=UPI00351A861F|nr:hypothetical protein LSM04_002579 [Trypanosoma melophagium]